ncbi:beta-ketoacyl synthase [Pseudonocardia kujensis]|uniref:beta-ketoacyl synthase n=1 Tax=Pseudonocardia kujensis TaxID=1128675 RepID=UPI001E634785|nr:beta-ketoacyl synthase [Pseudonocardia kujensis]MCE0764872.1 beta-ketoacyl synthase [Pseudonocardia kujensis]
MSTGFEEITFEGEPFDALAGAPGPQPGSGSVEERPTPVRNVNRTRTKGVPTDSANTLAARLVGELRAELVAAHRSAIEVQAAWQEVALAALRGGRPVPAAEPVQAGITRAPAAVVQQAALTAGPPRLALSPAGYRPEGGLEPLAPAVVTTLDAAALERLRRGDLAAVFGPRHERGEAGPVLDCGPLRAVTELRPGGPVGVAVLRGVAAPPADTAELRALAAQVAQVIAGWLGLPTVVPAARFAVEGGEVVSEATEGSEDPQIETEVEVRAEVTAADLLPRPWVRVDVELCPGGLVRGLTVAVREEPGTPLGTRRGGNPPALPVRRGVTGALAVVDELALATASLGDLQMALGPEFARYERVRATRPPAGGLRLVGRVMEVDGRRGDLTRGAGETEYDSAADAWYYGAAPSPSVPNVILMETSLQSALLLGYHLGATLTDPEENYSLRNLDGSATLHREVDLRGRTIVQRSQLLSTTVLAGAVLQSFSYELWLDGEDRDRVDPFYSGRSLFGFFNATALANQTGLDNGTFVPTWLEQHPRPSRTVPGGRTGASGELDLVHDLEVVDGGGVHGQGYVRARRTVHEGDWFFARHFHLDPVMPGSLGIEAVIQALQEWLVDTGALAELAEPEFVVPAGVELAWRYRGQILAKDGEMTLEAHVKRVERRPGRVRVVADASVWKPGLRIYELSDVAAEAREKGAPAW